MPMSYEDEVKFEGKRLWVHADFVVTSHGVQVENIRAYDMFPQSDYDAVLPTEQLVSKVEELIEEHIYE